jgi:hypothetical protein
MDTLNELAKGDGKATFVSHVFNFETESKNEMLNISQYALIAIIPIVLINKLMQIYIPDADEDKGTFEIVAEVIFQVLFIFIGMLIINRIITFVPQQQTKQWVEDLVGLLGKLISPHFI